MNEGNKRIEEQYLSTTVLKSIDILNLIARKKCIASEISSELRLNKTTVYRLLYTLEHAGFIEQLPNTHEYRIGIKLVGICSSRVNEIELITEAKPYLTELVRKINHPVHLGVYCSGKVVYIDKIDVLNTIRMYSAIGKSVPVHCSALGKSLLLDHSDEEILEVLSRQGMASFTNRTITDPQQFLKELKEARTLGYTVDNGEHEANVCCIAVPIYDYRNIIIAAISISMPIDMKICNETTAPLLIKTASMISSRLGRTSAPL